MCIELCRYLLDFEVRWFFPARTESSRQCPPHVDFLHTVASTNTRKHELPNNGKSRDVRAKSELIRQLQQLRGDQQSRGYRQILYLERPSERSAHRSPK